MKKNLIGFAFILCITGFIMFFRLGSLPLLDPDEPVYAQTALEMLASGDFVSPQIYGAYWYDKPPLYYWLTAASIYLCGNTEFAARLPSAIFALCTVSMVYFAGKRLLSPRAGFFAALALASSIEFLYLGKAAVTDMTLTFFFSAALLAYSQKRYFWLYASMGMAVLAKGPVGVVLPGAIILLHLLWLRRLPDLLHMKIPRGFALLLLIAAPWYLLMYDLHGNAFVSTFLGFHNVTRFLQSEHGASTKLYYYLPVLFVGFFPWGAYLMSALKKSLKERRGVHGTFLKLLLIWSGTVLLFFSLSQTKLISYILPMYPALALLTGWYIDQVFSYEKLRQLTAGNWFISGASCLIFGALAFFSNAYLGYIHSGLWLLGLSFSAMSATLFFACRKESIRLYIAGFSIGMAAFTVIVMQSLFPAALPLISVKAPSETFLQSASGNAVPVYIDKFYRPGFYYYTGVSGKELLSPLTHVMEEENRAYFIVKANQYARLPKDKQSELIVMHQQGKMMLLYKDGATHIESQQLIDTADEIEERPIIAAKWNQTDAKKS